MPVVTWADGDVPTAAQLNANFRDQVVSTVTSGTRPSGTEGQVIYETDTDRYMYYTGAAWDYLLEPPQSWSLSSVTQSGSRGCSTTYGWYRRSRGVFEAQIVLTSFSVGSAGNAILMATPMTLVSANAIGGTFTYLDNGTANEAGIVDSNSTTQVSFACPGEGSLGISPSLALAAADILRVTLIGRYA